MNLSRAKKPAEISGPVSGRAALEQAAKKCTKKAAEYHPDRRPGDKKAEAKFRELIEARDYFEKQLPHGCIVCGITISRGATHCRIHQGQKRLPGTGHQPPHRVPNDPRDNGNARVSVQEDHLALLGYYTAPVQKVVKKWINEIGEAKLRDYFEPVATTILSRETEMKLPMVAPTHWAAVFDLGKAILAVLGNKRTPHGWILRDSSIHVATNGRYPSIEEIRQRIIANGGPKKIKPANIAQALKGMRLSAAKAVSAAWRNAWPS